MLSLYGLYHVDILYVRKWWRFVKLFALVTSIWYDLMYEIKLFILVYSWLMGLPEAHLTNFFSLQFKYDGNSCCSHLDSNKMTAKNFEHNPTTLLSWHMQIFVAIWWPVIELWQVQPMANLFELPAKFVSDIDPRKSFINAIPTTTWLLLLWKVAVFCQKYLPASFLVLFTFCLSNGMFKKRWCEQYIYKYKI